MAKLLHFRKRVGKYKSILSSWNPNITYIRHFNRRNPIKEGNPILHSLNKIYPKEKMCL